MRTQLTGHQLAGWRPKKTSPPVYAIELAADQAIPLSDSTVLRGDLYRPKAEGKFPVLVAWSPYTKELQNTGLPLPINEVGVTPYIVSRGYCHLIVNARGTGKSAGQRGEAFSPCEQRDVAEVIEWAAQQPWCDGKVGMTGMSYFAVIQYLAAARRPAHLRAIFPYLGFTDLYRHFVSRGGAFHSDFFATYYTFVGATQHLSVPPLVRHALSHAFSRQAVQSLIMRLFFMGRTKMPGRLHPEETWARGFATLACDEPYDGPFYREKSAWPVLDQIEVPVCIGTNWGNPGLHMKGAFQAWALVRAPKKLFIGPPDPRWPWRNYQEELLAWYDYYLKEIDTGITEQPPVRYWLMGAECWKSASDWPVPGAVKRRLFLWAQTPENLERQALSTAPPVQENTLSFVALPRHMLYPRQLDRYDSQVLSYSTAPFERNTEVVGPLRLHLRLSSTTSDTHIIARVSDLAPEGTVRKLSFGWLQASHRAIDQGLSRPDEIVHAHRTAEPLSPGVPVTLDFSLTPTANLFQKGHRLLLELASNPDRLETNAFEGFIFFSYDAPPYPARNTIYHGGDDASYLEYEVLEEHRF